MAPDGADSSKEDSSSPWEQHSNSTPDHGMERRYAVQSPFLYHLENLTIFFYYLHWFSKPVWAKWLYLYFLKIKTEHSCVLRYIPQNLQSLSLVPLESLLTPQALTHALSLYTVFSLLTSASAPYSSPLGKTKSGRGSGWLGESERWNLSAP